MDIEKLADEIVEHLFTNGAGQKAQRLVLELPSYSSGGGWCAGAVRDVIIKAIREAIASNPR